MSNAWHGIIIEKKRGREKIEERKLKNEQKCDLTSCGKYLLLRYTYMCVCILKFIRD